MRLRTIVSLLLLLAAPLAWGGAIQALDDVERAVRTYVEREFARADDVEYSLGRLDPRLRLPLCTHALTAQATHRHRSSGPLSVEVRCEGVKPWALYVPVDLVRYADVVVARRPLARDHVVAADDLALERRRLDAGRQDYLTAAAAAVGLVVARPLAAGQVVGHVHLRRPQLVRRGDRVTLTSGARAVQVQMRGEALEDGAAGERISVLNLRSERVVEGVVTAAGEVEIRSAARL